jgi:hypothetical protein
MALCYWLYRELVKCVHALLGVRPGARTTSSALTTRVTSPQPGNEMFLVREGTAGEPQTNVRILLTGALHGVPVMKE